MERDAEGVDEVPVAMEPADFDAFYRREYAHILALVLSLVRSRPLAEDVAQEAFLAAHRRWRTVAAYDRPGAFVRRVAMNLAVSSLRRRTREAAALQRLFTRPAPSEMLEGDFWEALAALPLRQRQVAALHYVDDASVADIAEVLGIASGTVKAHLFAARRALAERLAVEEGEDL